MGNHAEYESLTQNALKLLYLTTGIQMLFLLLPFLAGGWALQTLTASWGSVLVFASGALLCLVLFLTLPKLRHARYRYLIADDRLEIIEGIFFIKRTLVPIDRVHQIDVARGPLDRFCGVAKVVVTTAGSAAAFRFIEPERAEQIALYLNATIEKKLRAARGPEGTEQDV